MASMDIIEFDLTIGITQEISLDICREYDAGNVYITPELPLDMTIGQTIEFEVEC